MSLTTPQKLLLADLHPNGLYIRRFGQYGRTASALVSKGYAVIDEPDYSGFRQDHYVLTDKALKWLGAAVAVGDAHGD